MRNVLNFGTAPASRRGLGKFKSVLGGSVIAALALAGCAPAETEMAVMTEQVSPDVGGPAVVRRLTRHQYRTIIGDLFGGSIVVGGPFEPDVRESGLLAVGASTVSIASTGLEAYTKMARNIAAQVVDSEHRDMLMGCAPAAVDKPDDACASQFLSRVGRYMFRRPLTDAELQDRVAAANESANIRGNFYLGIETALVTLLVSPNFLFIHEASEPDPQHPGLERLDAYSKASRLSFFLWNNSPDEALLAAAESGALHTRKGVEEQVNRMLASPQLESGVRAFFTDMLEFEIFDTLSKDQVLYPKFNFTLAEAAKEQTLRTIIDHLLVKNGDYRDLYTTPNTFLTRELAAVYQVPLGGLSKDWIPYEYPAGAQHAGILSQVSFVALHSHPGRTSPTLRGKALREVLLCQKVPDPPGDVNFTIVQDTANPNFKTVRQRLDAHASEPMCVGCHKITDPMGLALENFDTIGGYRASENGADIDTSGSLDGIAFQDALGLGKAMHDNPATASCLTDRVYNYGVGRQATKSESEWLKASVLKDFAANDYQFPHLLKRIATSGPFFRVNQPETSETAQEALASAATNVQ